MVDAYLALGSNQGDRLSALRGARHALSRTAGVELVAFSSLYETAPVGGPAGQGPYLNAVLQVRCGISPRDLLHRALEVEASFGRRRSLRWGPRPLDIDLLLFGDEIRHQPDLQLPHPRLHQRPFVLRPLSELAPGLIHPPTGRSVQELAADFPREEGVVHLSETW